MCDFVDMDRPQAADLPYLPDGSALIERSTDYAVNIEYSFFMQCHSSKERHGTIGPYLILVTHVDNALPGLGLENRPRSLKITGQ